MRAKCDEQGSVRWNIGNGLACGSMPYRSHTPVR